MLLGILLKLLNSTDKHIENPLTILTDIKTVTQNGFIDIFYIPPGYCVLGKTK